jgi:phosphatidylethanolamine-binding protein
MLATMMRMTGTSYAVMMVDLDIPTSSPPETSTLLHWMQTDLTPASTPTVMNTTAGRASVFLLQMPGAMMAAAPYFGPSPPNRVPLEHRYTQLLVDTSGASQQAMGVLIQAAQQRQGFSAEKVLTQAGLTDKVVAGNFFVVANPGPAAEGNGTTTTIGGSGTTTGGGSGRGSAFGTGAAGVGESASPFRNAAASAVAGPRGFAMAVAALVCAVALNL